VRLTELLRLHQIDSLSEILSTLGQKPPKTSDRETLVRTICELLLDVDSVRDVLISLEPDERAALYRIIFDSGHRGSSGYDVSRFTLGFLPGRRTQRFVFAGLSRYGILHGFVRPFQRDGEQYVLPQDLLEVICHVLAKETSDRCGTPIPTKETPDGFSDDPLLKDLLTLLILAAPEGIPYTRDHVPYRKVLKQLEAILPPIDLADEVLVEPYWHWRTNRYLTLRLALLFYFFEQNRLLEWDGRRCMIRPQHFQQLQIDASHRFSHWMEIPIYDYSSRFLARRLMAVLIQDWPDGIGLDPKKLLGWSDPFAHGSGFSFDREIAAWVAGYLIKLILSGVLTVVRPARSGPLLVPTPFGRSLLSGKETESSKKKGIFVVQPDFEVIADTYSLVDAADRVAPFVELVSVDQTFVLRLSRQSVQRGIRARHSIKSLQEGLEQASLQKVPDNVEKTLHDWAESYRRICVRSALLIETETEEQAEVVRRGAVSKYITDQIAPTVFRAHIEDLPQVRRALKKLRIDVVEELTEADRDTEPRVDLDRGLWRDVPKPEVDPERTFTRLGARHRQKLMSYEIMPPGASTQERPERRRAVRPDEVASPFETRAEISEAIRVDALVRLKYFTRQGPQESIVRPICWCSARGRFEFEARRRDGSVRTWKLGEIISAQMLDDNTAD